MSWPLVSLHQICRPKQWKTIASSKLLETGFPVYGANGIIGFYSEYTHEHPTLMITCRGATCGNVHISKPQSYINGNAMALDSLDKTLVDIRYLYYFFKSRGFKDVISGSAQPQITGQGLTKVQIPLPPLAEQKRIAAILDKADAIRQKRQQAIKLADDFLRSVFLDMFGDPVTNPKGWEVKKFGDVGNLDRGKSKHRPRNDPKLLGGEHPLIQTGDVANSGGYLTSFKSTYSDIGLAQSRMWPKGTLCITIAANIAKTGILTFKACFPDSVVGFSPNEAVTTEYVQNWLSFLQKILEANAPESAQKNINLAILRDLDIPVPPIKQQMKFTKLIEKLNNINSKAKVEVEVNNHLFNSLSQKAFAGEL